MLGVGSLEFGAFLKREPPSVGSPLEENLSRGRVPPWNLEFGIWNFPLTVRYALNFALGTLSSARVRKTALQIGWLCVAALGAWGLMKLLSGGGEPVNSGCLLLAALCSYAIGFRFYAKWIAARVLILDDRRATPCEVHDDGTRLCQNQ